MFFLRLEVFPLSETVGLFRWRERRNDMSFFFPRNLVVASRRSCKLILSFLWSFGLFSGVSVAACADNPVSLMRACCDAGVSIVGLLTVPFLPFLISAFAVYCSALPVLYLTGFCKSFLLGFCVCAVSTGFPGGGWLMCLLLLFTDLLTVPGLFLFQFRCLSGCKGILQQGLWTALWFVAVCIADYLWVVPLLRDII